MHARFSSILQINLCTFSTSDWIQLSTLVVVLAYTIVTLFLLLEQRKQFNKSMRPWVFASDLSFNQKSIERELAVILFNIGRVPARCTVSVGKLSVTQLLGREVVLLNKTPATDFLVFPHVQGTDSTHMFFLNLTEEQFTLLTDHGKLFCHLMINYQTIDDSSSNRSYSYEALIAVEDLEVEKGKQTTLVEVLKAT